MPNTVHKHLTLLFFPCTHGLLRIHSYQYCIYRLDSRLLINLQGLTLPSFYTNQLLHKPAVTQTLFYSKHFLSETHFHTNQFLHKPAFTHFFFTNHLLHKPALTQTNFYTHQFLRKSIFRPTSFTQTTFCTNQLVQTCFYTNTNQFFTRTSFYTNQLLDKSPFAPTTLYTNQLYTTLAVDL